MCTVTIVRQSGVIRMVCNRDELRTRPLALPPQTHSVENRKFVAPIDPVSNGTWVAVNDTGLLMTLLNVNPKKIDENWQTHHQHHHASRGGIIPSLMIHGDAKSAAEVVKTYDAATYPPFRLIMVDRAQLIDARSDGRSLTVEELPFGESPWMFASSGLGDHLVEPPRRELFESMFSGDSSTFFDVQGAFHHHQWPNRMELSVCMARPDARTVSCTAVEVRHDEARMVYHAGPPNESAEETVCTLSLQAG